jgi:hypothetical protein
MAVCKSKIKPEIMSWANDLFNFYKGLKPPAVLPEDIEWLYPQKDPEVMNVVKIFLDKYYNDTRYRRLLLGINPGRFGAGVTGVNFTAPKQLFEECGIAHSFKNQTELSAEFIYEMINAYGGPKAFYSNYFIGSVCPLGFIKNEKNINYYDDKKLLEAVEPFIIKAIKKQVSFPVDRDTCYAIGGEKNFKYLSSLNNRFQWFENIIPLPHPRFIMQYRRKKKQDYISQYLEALK